MSKAENIAAGVAIIGALKDLTGGGSAAKPQPNPRPDVDPPPDDTEDEGPDTITRADIDASIGCLDSIADSLELIAGAVKMMMEQAAISARQPDAPRTNHPRKG